MAIRRFFATAFAVLLAVGFLAGCGGSSDDSQKARGQDILAAWSGEINGVLTALKDSDEARVNSYLPRIEKWGRDARKVFVDDEPSEVTRAVIDSGDSWTEWAFTLRTDPPRGNFSKARRIADLASQAVGDYRRALRAVGVDPGPVVGGG